ncbi:MAG: HAMP domain-containing protein [Deltaproteobacteria bacterium]|nr:HAMP domain-containing protein [Deltaproteobacteria bacterium]
MKRKLSSYIGAAFFINVFAIISVGGICILMVNDMVRNISHLEQESENVARIFKLNDKIQKAIFTVHSSIVDYDFSPQPDVIQIINQIEEELRAYKEDEFMERSPHVNEEMILLDKLQDNLINIRQVLDEIYHDLLIASPLDEAGFKKLEGFGFNVHNLTQSINDVHFRTVSALVKESYSKMYFILTLYLACSFVGILASCVGYMVLTRHTIKPIINLATATEKISSGNLGIRVDTDSETEIGTLYHSFNAMTEKLQEHEKKRDDFNRTLEILVQERTSELRESEESLRRTQSELVRMEKIATLGQIATSVNHEIKTPLNVLYMNLQLLIRKINQCQVEENHLKQGMLDLTEIINNEIARINEIIEEFVKYARFPAPNIKGHKINKIMADIAEMINQNAQEANIAIEVMPDDTLDILQVDEKMMIQAMLNLCMNAIQAMPYGGRLRLESSKEEECAKIVIADTGEGIAADDLDKIFDPFFTKKDGGLGFGLAIVQRIIENHNGAITCKSEVGKGTIFEITLPIPPNDTCRKITEKK